MAKSKTATATIDKPEADKAKPPKRKAKVRDETLAVESVANAPIPEKAPEPPATATAEAMTAEAPAEANEAATATPDAIDGHKLHPLCTAFPPMSAERFDSLKASIQRDGLDTPITRFEGAVLDGRNRLRACVELGVEPRFVEFEGSFEEALALVERRNLERRDLSPSQRAMIAVEIKRQLESKYAERQKSGLKHGAEAPEARSDKIVRTGEFGRAREEAAAAVGVSQGYIADAERIKEASPGVAEAVKRGEKTIPQAKRELGIDKPKPKPSEAGTGPKAPEPGPATIEQESPGEESASVDDFAEAREEREAMQAEVSDDEWLAALPLNSELQGVSLNIFRRDALLFRRMDDSRQLYANKARREIGVAKKGRKGSVVGHYEMALSWHIRFNHPKDWHVCPAEDKGGCGGSGRVPSGPCPTCKETGYLTR